MVLRCQFFISCIKLNVHHETRTLILHSHFELVKNKYYLTYKFTYGYTGESEIYLPKEKLEVSDKSD